MTLMYGKIGLLGMEKGAYEAHPHRRGLPAHGGRAAGRAEGHRIEVPGKPDVFLFEVDRGRRGPLYVVWQRRDAFSGEDAPAIAFDWPWQAKRAHATDALGATVPVEVKEGRVHLAVSLTPIYLEGGGVRGGEVWEVRGGSGGPPSPSSRAAPASGRRIARDQ